MPLLGQGREMSTSKGVYKADITPARDARNATVTEARIAYLKDTAAAREVIAIAWDAYMGVFDGAWTTFLDTVAATVARRRVGRDQA